jgi:sterol desaturase/sphingolipid hydroxylase (fatty acid hydroxylase superfamily)
MDLGQRRPDRIDNLFDLVIAASPVMLIVSVCLFVIAISEFIRASNGVPHASRLAKAALLRNPLVPVCLIGMCASLTVFTYYFFNGEWLSGMRMLPGLPSGPSSPAPPEARIASAAISISAIAFVFSTIGYGFGMLYAYSRPVSLS